MSCKLCQKVKPKKLERIDKALKRGRAPEAVSLRFNVPVRAVRRHLDQCLKLNEGGEKPDNYKTLQDLLSKVIEDLDSARTLATYSDPEEARSGAIFYSALLREARELILSLEKLRSFDQVLKEVETRIVNPFGAEMGRILLEEGAALKSELQASLGNQYDHRIDDLLKTAWKNLIVRFMHSRSKLLPSLQAVLSGDKLPESETPVLQLNNSTKPVLH